MKYKSCYIIFCSSLFTIKYISHGEGSTTKTCGAKNARVPFQSTGVEKCYMALSRPCQASSNFSRPYDGIFEAITRTFRVFNASPWFRSLYASNFHNFALLHNIHIHTAPYFVYVSEPSAAFLSALFRYKFYEENIIYSNENKTSFFLRAISVHFYIIYELYNIYISNKEYNIYTDVKSKPRLE